MTNEDDREATASLAHRLRDRDAAEPGDRTDPDVFAAEFIAVLRAHGWRPTLARPAVDWRVTEKPADEQSVHQYAADARAAIRATRAGGPT